MCTCVRLRAREFVCVIGRVVERACVRAHSVGCAGCITCLNSRSDRTCAMRIVRPREQRTAQIPPARGRYNIQQALQHNTGCCNIQQALQHTTGAATYNWCCNIQLVLQRTMNTTGNAPPMLEQTLSTDRPRRCQRLSERTAHAESALPEGIDGAAPSSRHRAPSQRA